MDISPFFHLSGTWWEIPLRTALVYLLVLLGLRLTGKRELGQMTSFDLVLLLLLANAVQNAMTGPDTSLLGGVLSATTLLLVSYLLVTLAYRFRPVARGLEGDPTILISEGKFLRSHLEKERVTEDEVVAALREHGVASVGDVAAAVLEVDGTISVIRSADLKPAEPASAAAAPQPKPSRHPIRFLHSRH